MNRQLLVKGLLCAALLVPGLALGAVHPPVLAICVLAGAGLYFFLLMDRRGLSLARIDLAGGLLLGLALFTAFQMIPLPAGLVEIISPNAYDVRAGALEPLGVEPPSWMPLSIDVTFTAVELGKLLFYAAVYFTCMIWTRKHGSGLVLGLVVTVGVAVAFVFLAHKIFMLESVYGIYEPVHKQMIGERVSAPLMNENHLAALLGMTATVAVGMAVSAKERSRRILLILMAAVLGGSLLLTLSRGGIAAFVVGQLLFVALRIITRIASRRKDDVSNRQIAWLPLGLALSAALGLFVAQDAIIGEFVAGDHSKIEMLSEGMPLVKKFPVTGVGRGAFWVGFPLVSDWGARVTYTHAENAIVQLLADWGLLVGGIALLGFVIAVGRRLIRSPKRTGSAAALAALVAFGVHNLVDFNMEIPAVAVLAAALLGALSGSDSSRSGERGSAGKQSVGRGLSRPSLVALVLASVCVSAVIGLHIGSSNLDLEERKLMVALSSRNAESFNEENLRPILERHPASWYLPFTAGVNSFRTRKGNPLRWFSRSLELNSDSAATHLMVGRTLLGTGHMNQAMLEFRISTRGNPGFARTVAGLLVAAEPDFEMLSGVAADDDDRLLLWGALGDEFALKGLEDQAEAADTALLKVGTRPRSMARQALRLSDQGHEDRALELAEALGKLDGHEASAAVLKSQIHRRGKNDEGAIEVLEAALEAYPEDRKLLFTLAGLYKNVDHGERARELVSRLKRLSSDSRALSSVSAFEGDLELANGRIRAALACYRQAYALTPGNKRLLIKIADLAEKEGDHARAIEALRKLMSLDPANEMWKRRLGDLEGKIKSGTRRLIER